MHSIFTSVLLILYIHTVIQLLLKSFPEDISKYMLLFINIRLLAICMANLDQESKSQSQSEMFIFPETPLFHWAKLLGGREVHRVLFFRVLFIAGSNITTQHSNSTLVLPTLVFFHGNWIGIIPFKSCWYTYMPLYKSLVNNATD